MRPSDGKSVSRANDDSTRDSDTGTEDSNALWNIYMDIRANDESYHIRTRCVISAHIFFEASLGRFNFYTSIKSRIRKSDALKSAFSGIGEADGGGIFVKKIGIPNYV